MPAQARLEPDARSLIAASGLTFESIDLGLRDYAEAWELQKTWASERAANRRQDTLIFVQHTPVFTRGSSARGGPMSAVPYAVYDVERGGDITYHGPGQLVGYPIMHLGERNLKVGTYLRALESVLIETLAGLGLCGERRPGLTGVWCEGKKAASIGVAVRGWVSYHGFALNVDCDLAHFQWIRPCGLDPLAMTSLSALGKSIGLLEARERVLEAFLKIF